MEKFRISIDPTDKISEVVSCTKRDLFMRVLLKPMEIPDTMLALTFTLHSKKIEAYDFVFEVLYRDLDRDYTKWDMQLFQEAVVHYCVRMFEAEPDGLSAINLHNFYPYERGEIIY